MGMIEELVEGARAGVERRRAQVPLEDLERRVGGAPEQRPFGEALTRPGLSVIAEFKRRSPSAGEIRDAAPAERAESRPDLEPTRAARELGRVVAGVSVGRFGGKVFGGDRHRRA
jgi:hypothetical protein